MSLTAPDDGATVNLKLQLTWNDATDPDGGTVSYKLYLDAKTNPTTLVASGASSATIKYLPTIALSRGTKYYWKVVTTDEEGYSSTSAVRNFTTTTTRLLFSSNAHGSEVWAVAIQPTGGIAASGAKNGNIILWNTSTGAAIRTITAQTSQVRTLEFSPDGTKLLSGDYAGKVKIWTVSTGALVRTISGHGSQRVSATYSPDGNKILTGGYDKRTRVWIASTGASSVIFSPDAGSSIATVQFLSPTYVVSTDINGNANILIIDGTSNGKVDGSQPIYKNLANRPAGTTIPYAVAVQVKADTDWNTDTQWQWRIGSAGFVNGTDTYYMHMANMDIQNFASPPLYGSSLGYYAYDAGPPRTIPNINYDVSTKPVFSIKFAGTSLKYVSGCGDGKVRVYTAQKNASEPISETIIASTATGNTKYIRSVDISDDGNIIISGSVDGFVKIWDGSGI